MLRRISWALTLFCAFVLAARGADPDTFSPVVSYQYFDPPADLPTLAVQSNNVSYTFDDQPTPTPSPSPPVTPTPTPTPTSTATPPATPTPTPSVSPSPIDVILSIHAVSSLEAIANEGAANVDEQLVPWPDIHTLSQAVPVSAGLVADGVTPLVIKLTPTAVPTQPTAYEIAVNMTGGSLSGKPIGDYVTVLQPQSGGEGAQWVSTKTVSLSPSHPIGFAYLGAIKSQNVGSKELSVVMTVKQTGTTGILFTKSFKIGKPPIALVHGYNSSRDAWSAAFLSKLRETRPCDFVVPIEYGVKRAGNEVDKHANTDGKLVDLAATLHEALEREVEEPLHAQWAFTRYDVIAHSQGGVLTRMLCTKGRPAYAPPFRSTANAGRGRFHRVITIGSPHNGSTFAYYLQEAVKHPSAYAVVPAALIALGVLQDKFSPFGDQLEKINGSDWMVEPTAKFHLIATSIADGDAPPLISSNVGLLLQPSAYSVTGLCGSNSLFTTRSRGSVVLPSGSDGVVDLKSQLAGGNSTPFKNVSADLGVNIAHASGPFGTNYAVFRVTDDNYDTRSPQIAATAADLLNGPSTNFGSFIRQPLSPTLQSEIDRVVPRLGISDIIRVLGPLRRGQSEGAETSESFSYQLEPGSAPSISGAPTWFAEVFGPSGVTTTGVELTVPPDDATKVTVAVDANLVGDVILYVSYTSTAGDLIFGTPVIVVSRPAGANLRGIRLVPETVSLTTGTTVRSEVWGDYDNGSSSRLYVAATAAITYNSSDAAVASVDRTGAIALESPGSALVTVSYLGFSSQSNITVSAVAPPPVPDSSAPPTTAPIITAQPPSQNAIEHSSVTFSVGATSTASLAYRWHRNGAEIPGATSDSLTVSDITLSQAGLYTVVVTNDSGSVISDPAILTVTATQLANISTRLSVGTGDNALIGGFIITGMQPKKLLVRAIGPSLPVPGVLGDTKLELFNSAGQLIDSNNNWRDALNSQEIIDSTIPPSHEFEAAILRSLEPGAYTAVVRGTNETTGIGLVEVYDLDRTADSKLANISTRGFVQTGDNAMIAGTIILGQLSQKVIVRAIGPSLPFSGVVADPTLELRDGNGSLVAANDNWRNDQEAEIIATTIPPSNDFESAIVTTLPSNGASYTAIVRGLNDTTGIAVVEVYGLD